MKEELFSSETIAQAIIALGFNEECFGYHCGFKLFGEGPEMLRHKQVFIKGVHVVNDLQQRYDLPLFKICAAPIWQQISDFLEANYDIDIDVVKVRHDPDFKFEFSVMCAGKLVGSNRVSSRYIAMDNAVTLAIQHINNNV